MEKDELFDALKVILFDIEYLKETLGSNDESFSNSSNLPAILISKFLLGLG